MDPTVAAQQDPAAAEDYSAAATVIPFESPLPLLRGPIPAGPRDYPAAGRYVLAFKDPASWAAALRSCRSKIAEQCEEGARIGCAVAASRACAPPWWAPLIGQKVNMKEREACEVREMESCLADKKEKCAEFAKEKTLRPFMAARVGVRERGRSVISERLGKKLICCVSVPSQRADFGLLGLQDLVNSESSVTNYWASEIFLADEYL
ncbi:uncharacterized protein LOC116188925 [Punica granatum]|uniref:Uncharacterized protein n=2 Tax=Punica granatum TaxID=22663 RepID=A0A218WRF4_PUNGR|nr:uncharacterized protein LOC116188925 [Punica granatum]OWM75206.1 hypothetical protein CDL15_Pgr023727 [Punica granatum]PKI63619.1 hypothetical protein CRG98_016002 [Punica granatum]